ncbi:response regulator transcription factor [Streptomyces sp. NPDC005774]|uniref:response regulator transcription factor n=1 Tax=Streptomyces sp. NPDC005774 TaxID=3364728 RepID=UPI0036BA4CD5
MTAATMPWDVVARLRTAGLRLPRVLPGQEWRPITGAEEHLLSEARRLDRIRQFLLEEIGRLRAQSPSERTLRERSRVAAISRIKDCPLTAGQLEVLAAAASGETIEATARRMHITVDTVKSQRKRASDRIDARSMLHAVALAVASGWIPTEQDHGGTS